MIEVEVDKNGDPFRGDPDEIWIEEADAEKYAQVLIKSISVLTPQTEDGLIDYNDATCIPSVQIIVWNERRQRLLLLKRKKEKRFYPGKWACIGGKLDDPNATLMEHIQKELREEIGYTRDFTYRYARPYYFKDKDCSPNLKVFTIVVELMQPYEITLNEEHDGCEWVSPKNVKEFETIPCMKLPPLSDEDVEDDERFKE